MQPTDPIDTNQNQSTNNNLTDRKIFWWNVIASVIASVIVIALIQPMLTWLWEYMSSTGNVMLNKYVDHLYKNAALGNRNWVIAAIAISLLYIPIANFILVIGTRPLFKKLLQRKPGVTKLKIPTAIFVTLVVFSISGLIPATFLSISIYTDLQLNASFNQRLQVLTPHLSDHQHKTLLASWASMTSKNDYIKIKEEMDQLALQAKTTLPRPLLQD